MKKKVKNCLLGFLWVFGLIMAGSDSLFLPVANFLGVFLIGISSYLVVEKNADIHKATKKRSVPFRKMKPQLTSDNICLNKGY